MTPEHYIIMALLSLVTFVAGIKTGGRGSDKYLLKTDHAAMCSACKAQQQRETSAAFEQIKGLRSEMQIVGNTLSSIEGGLKAKGII